jgi:serine/threonine protein kinase/Tol biopolymer transport system component
MNPERWRQIEECYHAVLESSPEMRAAFLDRVCGEDVELRQEVESLLAHEEKAASFLETHAADTTRTLSAATAAGRDFGSYQILSLLGRGGMGEVYRAHDGKLGRDVALKTLPAVFAADPERLARFRREARTLASLNHPNIAAIYGLEESGCETCLVLELVEGETPRGPLPIHRTLEYARQVAEALEAAHRKGIIHRDLKPANLKVTPEGRLKVLDFGLAKALWGTEQEQDLSQVESATQLETVAGHIVGTPGYMSPEQARGSEVDQRTDIWAFGCLLFELLAGKRAFQGESLPETIEAVLQHEPDWKALPAKTPVGIRKLLRRCLEKDADCRLPRIRDARQAVEQAQRRPKRWPLAAAGIVALAGIAAIVTLRKPPGLPGPSEWVRITNFPDSVSQPALSPDGRMLAFVRGPDTFVGPGQIYVKLLPGGEAVELTRDDSPKMSPAFSPDGAQIAYTALAGMNWNTWAVSVNGGQPRLWLRNASGLVWFGKRMVFSEVKNNDLHMAIVSSEETRTGARDVYVPAGLRGMAHRSYPSPDGKWMLVVEMDRGEWLPCRLVPMDGTSTGRPVGPPGARCTSAAWAPDGKSIYVSSNAESSFHIWRQAFPDGRPELITPGPTEEEGIAVAPDGRSFITAVGQRHSVTWVRDSGGERQVSVEGYSYDPKFARDGKRLCYRILRGAVPISDSSELRVVDLESGRSDPLLPGLPVRGNLGHSYDIAPDGQHAVAAAPDRDGKRRLWLAALDGQSPPRQIPNVEGDMPFFGPGDEIYFRGREGTSMFAYAVRKDGTGLRKAVAQPVAGVDGVSPDGRWLAVRLPEADGTSEAAFPLRGGLPVHIGAPSLSQSNVSWSREGRLMFLWVASSMELRAGTTYALPLPAGRTIPAVPAGGFRSNAEIAKVPGVRVIDGFAAPGPKGDVYAYSRETDQRNLFRIPIR